MKLFLGFTVLITGLTLALLPARARALPTDRSAPPFVRGAVHVHTSRSDGTGSQDSIAAAAARAGLQFVVFTDHGDGTGTPEPPAYRHGVLCLDGVEISTDNGHLVAIGLAQTPYPLGGLGRDVVEDVHRLGGMAIAAHPSSPRESLRWTATDASFDGIEWLNGDSQWRDEPFATLGRILLTYWLRPAESLGQLLDRPAEAMAMWDAASRTRPVVGMAAADAHARIGLRGVGEPYDDRPVGRLPGYESQFRAFSVVLPGLRLSGTAAPDAVLVVDAIRHGHLVSVIDALASPGWLEFSATSGRSRAEQGGVLQLDGAVSLQMRAPVVTGTRLSLLRDGREVSASDFDRPVTLQVPSEPATYRVEVTIPGAPGMPPVPWLVSNPIYVRAGTVAARPPAAPTPVSPSTLATADTAREWPLSAPGTIGEWTVEHSPRADGRVGEVKAVGGTQLLIRWALGGLATEPAFVAVARPLPASSGAFDALLLDGRASRPTRVSVQLRAPDGTRSGRRWARSIYLDETSRQLRLPLREFVPIGHDEALSDHAAGLDSLLFVVDRVNTALGSSGMFWVERVRMANPPQVRTDSRR